MPLTPLDAWLSTSGVRARDFATALGLTEPALSKIRRGRKVPSIAEAAAIAEATAGEVPITAWVSKSPGATPVEAVLDGVDPVVGRIGEAAEPCVESAVALDAGGGGCRAGSEAAAMACVVDPPAEIGAAEGDEREPNIPHASPPR